MINVRQIKSRYQRLCQLVSSRRVKDSLDVLNQLVSESGYSDFFIQQEHLAHTYEQMLNYMLEGVQDPERDMVYNKLLISILELEVFKNQQVIVAGNIDHSPGGGLICGKGFFH